MPRPSSATDSRKPSDAHGRTRERRCCRARECRTALVSASCAMPMISRSTPPPNGGSSSIVSSIGTRWCAAPGPSCGGARRATSSPPLLCGRSAPTERRASTMCVRARSTAVSRLSRDDGGGSAGAERCAACSCIRMAAKPWVSVSWMSRAMRLRSSSTAWRRASSRLLLRQPAVVQRQRRLPRRSPRSARDASVFAVGATARRTAPSIQIARRQHERDDDQRATDADRRVERRGRPRAAARRRRRSRPSSSSPARRRAGARHASRGSASAAQSSVSLREELSVDVGHPQSQREPSSSSSHTPQAWLSQSSTSDLDERPEEAGDVRLADEQVERQLHGVALDVGHALGAAALVHRRLERRGERLDDGSTRSVVVPERRRESLCLGSDPSAVTGMEPRLSATPAGCAASARRTRCRSSRPNAVGSALRPAGAIARLRPQPDCFGSPRGTRDAGGMSVQDIVSRHPGRCRRSGLSGRRFRPAQRTARTAQPAAPCCPTVTVAEVVVPRDHRVGRVHRPPRGRQHRRRSGRASPATSRASASARARSVRSGDLLFQIDPRPFQAEVDRLRAELARARATDPARRRPSSQRAERLAAENAMSERGARSPRRVRRRSPRRRSPAVEAALARRRAEPRVHPRDRADRRPRRPRHRHRRQPGVERARRGHAADDGRVARSDLRSFDADEQTFLRYGDLARQGKRVSARQQACRSAWRSPATRRSRARAR